jgi:hypothetical protein
MPEPQNFVFNHKEIAEALIKQQDLHEGLWGVYIEFGIAGANINQGPDGDNLLPAAIVPVLKIGIQRFPKPNNLTVDASQVNPAKQLAAPSKHRTTAKGKRSKSSAT